VLQKSRPHDECQSPPLAGDPDWLKLSSRRRIRLGADDKPEQDDGDDAKFDTESP
jgi:hypothetical protein